MADLPDWMYPPNPGGWTADDLDLLPPEAPRHIELIDGALVLMMSPQRSFHARVMGNLLFHLASQAPTDVSVELEMTVRLNKRNRPEPDLVAVTAPYDANRTYYLPSEVVLAVEIVSDESAERDRDTKPRKYAEAGIPHFWRVEEEKGAPVVHVFELDVTTKTYVPTAIERAVLRLKVPYPLEIDLSLLTR
ncbi:MAG: Uma2 family endonuclease [Streptomycetaceae bacterium]|nr:Uma2 family endonuclease [Streptomycetaceae bacterium]